MPALRFLAALFALIAVLALATDLTPAITGNGAFNPKSITTHWTELAPKTLESAKQSVSRSVSPALWDGLSATVLALPAFLFFALMAAIFGYAGRRRHRINIYIN